MIWIETSAPAAEPVPVAELRAFLRLDRDDEDALLARLLRAAREDVERRTGLFVAERSGRLVLPAGVGTVTLGFRPVTLVASLALLDADGGARESEADLVRIENTSLRTCLHWRRPIEVTAGGVELELVAGLSPDRVPESLRLAMLRMAATAYETRAMLTPSQDAGSLSPLVRSLLSPFRALSV